ncbi:respiratory-chain NADH dehydrogenase subunit 1 [Candidatus Magnetobacterium bavaricum]|uniref:Respiratory-chain NADH dehydrogenase subunit 1 n=1 Tax=Candidatus Magnetobacterium bavaricum TaxID=29290 RepID=A0A0F3GP12_9BACT|nr:respiratory-chain NADH dehydrogenase subunit 1 [Candidatus Magnetobacterium bavaricum]
MQGRSRRGRSRPSCRGLGGEAPILSLTKPPTTFLCTPLIRSLAFSTCLTVKFTRMRVFFPVVVEALQLVVLLAGAPIFVGWVRMLKCWSQGRSSAGLLQPYRDIRKLFSKDIVIAENASWIFRFTPYLVFGVAVLQGGIIPILSAERPLAATADVIVLVALFTIARFFTALAAMDIGTAFGGMGASREMTIASLSEPAMLMAIFTVSLATKSTSLAQMVQLVADTQFLLRPSIVFAFLAFVMVALAETGRIPVDNPSTHLELTMVHEAMTLEYSGRHLALIEWAKMMKLFLFVMLATSLFFPWGIANVTDFRVLVMTFVLMLIKLLVVGVGLILIEVGLAKMRLFRLTEFLGSSFLLATLGMLSFYILE